MIRKPAIIALLSLALAASAFAQSAEFGRFSGGEIELMTKHARPFSGSLSLTSNKGFGASLGGTIVPDRVWFFGSVNQVVSQVSTANLSAQLGSRQDLAASFNDTRQQQLFASNVPTSFLSLRYTGIVSDNMFFTASMSQQRNSTLLPR